MDKAVRVLQGQRDAGLDLGAGDFPVCASEDARAGHLAGFRERTDNHAARFPRSKARQVLLLGVRGTEPHAG